MACSATEKGANGGVRYAARLCCAETAKIEMSKGSSLPPGQLGLAQ